VKLSSGRDAVVGYIARGDFFGEKSFLTPRRAGQIAEALSPVKVSAFRKSELVACLQRDRRFALRVLRNLTLRLDRTEEMIHAFVTDPAERRLARLLLRFVPASAVSGWVRLRFSPSNADLGKTIGTTRWRIAHFMRHFQDLGWLIRRHGLVVRSEGLREFLS
jgi:CRP/FNR family transcriptional regulator